MITKKNIQMMKKTMIVTYALLHFISVKAQQDPMFTHYSFNTQAINPAYAGSRDALTITALHRSQWVGFEGAPVTQTLTLHTPVLTEKLGMGLSLINDKIGPTNTTSVYADFAYKIKMGQTGKLAFGLKGGFSLMQGKLNSLSLNQANDLSFANNIESKFLPNFGFGVYYYAPKWYAGLSIPKLVENDFQKNTVTGSTNLANEQRHYYFIAGTVFELNRSLKFKPTTFIKVTNGSPIEGDLTGMLILFDRIELGMMYRSADALGLLFGLNIGGNLRVGYAFDWSYSNATIKYNGGSHEIMLRFDFVFKNKGKIRSPRYF